MGNNLETRKMIYGLLFTRPLFNYLIKSGKNRVISVLIIGDDDASIEAFKAVYWCGRMTDKIKLKIAVCSSDINRQKKIIKESMPGLNNTYLNTQLCYMSIEQLQKCDLNDYGYIFISEPFNKNPIDFKVKESADKHECILCYFDPQGEEKVTRFASGNISIERIQLSTGALFEKEMNTLNRYAYNSNFAYQLSINEGYKKEKFKKFKKKELVDNDRDCYNYLSSLAFPLHFKYKLEICRIISGCGNGNREKEQVLVDAICREKSELYNILRNNEHDRWVAYMVSEGWRMPTDHELSGYAFQNGSDQILFGKKHLHPCMCKGTQEEGNITKHPELWEKAKDKRLFNMEKARAFLKKEYPGEEYSDLEAITVVLYGIVCRRADAVIKDLDKTKDALRSEETMKNELNDCIDKVIKNEPGSEELYNITVKRIKENLPADDIGAINELNKKLGVVFERNRHKNYFLIDSSMIDSIPFCLNYGFKYDTVITVSSGSPIRDVIVPTLFRAERAVFLIPQGAQEYKTIVENYFSVHGKNNTKTEFIECMISSADKLKDTICQTIKENPYKHIILNCVEQNDIQINMAIINAAGGNLPIYSYSQKNGLTCIKNDKLLGTKLLRGSFTLEEYLCLMNSSHLNIYDLIPLYSDYKMLMDLFKKYSSEWYKVSTLLDGKISGLKSFCSAFFGKDRKIRTEFVEDLERTNIIKVLDISNNDLTIEFRDNYAKRLLMNKGTLLEVMIYYKLRESALFNDVGTGVMIQWDCISEKLYNNVLEKEPNAQQISNEVDVIAINGFESVFISCKACIAQGKDDLMLKWIYEIRALADRFGAYPVLIELYETSSLGQNRLERAKRMGVSVIGYETIFNTEKLNKALKLIAKGEVVIGTEL